MKKPIGSASCSSPAQASMPSTPETTGAAIATMPFPRTSRYPQKATGTNERMQQQGGPTARSISRKECPHEIHAMVPSTLSKSRSLVAMFRTRARQHFRQMKGIKSHQVICSCQILRHSPHPRQDSSRALGLPRLIPNQCLLEEESDVFLIAETSSGNQLLEKP